MPGPAGYWWGAALIALGVILGGTLFAVGLGSALGGLPALSTQFDAQTSATQVTAPAHWALYVRSRELPAGTCTVTSAAGSVSVTPASGTMQFDRQAGHWTWVANVDGQGPGTYAVTCPPGHYAVGEQPHIAGFALGIVGAVIGLILPLLLGLGGGAALIIVTAVRRARARRAVQGAPS
jgi:hypothetical protein